MSRLERMLLQVEKILNRAGKEREERQKKDLIGET